MTREEYGAIVMGNLGIQGEKALAQVAVAMVKRMDNDTQKDRAMLIRELESIVEELKRG